MTLPLADYLHARPDRLACCGAHEPTQGHHPACVARVKAGVLAAVDDATEPDERARIDAAILRIAALGVEFSANDVRPLVPGVHGPRMGARFNALARAGRIRRTGYTPSSKGNTHGHPVAVWRAA